MSQQDHQNDIPTTAPNSDTSPTPCHQPDINLLERQTQPLALRDQHEQVIRVLKSTPVPELAQSISLGYWLALAFLSSARVSEGSDIVRELEHRHPNPDALTAGRLSVLNALECIFSGDSQKALALTQHAISILPESALQELFRAWATTEVLSIHFGDFTAGEHASTQLLRIRDQLPPDQYWWYAFVVPNRADWLLKTGMMDAARQLLEAQLQTCPPDTEAVIRIRLATIALENQDIDTTWSLIESLSDPSPDTYWYLEAELLRVECLRARKETEAAISALYAIIRNRITRGSNVEIFRPQLLLAEIWIDQGQRDLATAWLDLTSKSIDEWPRTYGHPIPGMTRCRLAIARGDWEDAENQLQRLREIGVKRKHDGLLVRIYSHLAYVVARQGRNHEAADMAMWALEAARNGDFSASLTVGNSKILDLLTHDPQNVMPPTQQPQDPLSQREMETLRLLAEHRSNQQIADILFISRNTVKIHLQNVYRKLGTTNRREAVEVARWMGLLNTPSPPT